MKVKSVSFDNKTYHFFKNDNDSDESENLFTILVGRNGSGKSRIFQKICLLHLNSIINSTNNIFSFNSYNESTIYKSVNDKSSLNYGEINYKLGKNDFSIKISKPNDLYDFSNRSLLFEKKSKTLNCNFFHEIKKIIAVSTSPFDKFPIPSRNFHLHENNFLEEKYIYRGAKIKINSQKDYLKTKFDQLGSSLINFFLRADKSKNKVSILLDTIGVDEKISMYFAFPWPFDPSDIINKEHGKNISESLSSIRFFKEKTPKINLSDAEEELLLKSLKLVMKYYDLKKHRNDNFSLDLNLFNVEELDNFDLLNSLSILANYDLIELVDIKFIKNKKYFHLTEASSGELSLIFNLLSIAGEIENESLILIDEPEISLHPEWQSNFIPLLHKMFSDYTGCHFIIATHSPQILSSIANTKSFIINLENDNKIIKGEEISEMSADYQLAYVFKEPGYKNEYLTRIALTTFTNVSKNKYFNSNDLISLDLLLENIKHMSLNDPLHQLILSLEEMRNFYA